AVDEIEVALLVLSHQVAGAEPRVSTLEDVTEDLLFRRFAAGVTLEAAADVRRIGKNLAERFSDFVRTTTNAEPFGVPHGCIRFDVELHERCRESMGEEERDASDRARLALDVEQRDVAFGGRVELQDLWNAKPLLEVVPDVSSQAVAAAHSDRVFGLMAMRLAVQQVATELADVLEERAVPPDHVAPELPRGKSVAYHDRAAGGQHRTGRQHAADAVVHRQAVVHAVVCLRVHHPREPVAPLHQAAMTDAGSLRQPRGARGVDQERSIVDRRRPSFLVSDAFGATSLNRAIDSWEAVVGGAMNPDCRCAGQV